MFWKSKEQKKIDQLHKEISLIVLESMETDGDKWMTDSRGCAFYKDVTVMPWLSSLHKGTVCSISCCAFSADIDNRYGRKILKKIKMLKDNNKVKQICIFKGIISNQLNGSK